MAQKIDYLMGKIQLSLSDLRKLGNKLTFELRNRIAGGVFIRVLSMFRIRSSQEPEYLLEILTRDNRRIKIVVPNSNST